jgi:very-short-patch-repair endonuclease
MKFRRQHNIGPFILDFYCPECRLAIELDGAGHHTEIGAERDYHRTQYLEQHKVRVLRFENKLIWENLEAVLEAIREAVRETKAGEGK